MFEAENEKHFPMSLPNGIIAKQVELTVCFEAVDLLEDKIFPEHENISRHFSTPKDRYDKSKRLAELQRAGHQESVVFYDGQTPIGYFMGRMLGASEFMMDETGIAPAYQQRGIYSAFVRGYLSYLCDVGYERVVSYHSPTNRAVLIAKLKLGFNIAGTVFREQAGASVQLTYFLYEDRLRGFEAVHSLQPDKNYPS